MKYKKRIHVVDMGGGLLQLVAQGAQDVILTSNPQVTLFKQVYRRACIQHHATNDILRQCVHIFGCV